MRMIYSSKFHWDLCKKEQPFSVRGLEEVRHPGFEQDALDLARHDHWTCFHRVCAVCGELVDREGLDLAVNDGSIPIHKDYTHFYGNKLKPGEIGFCLIVHKRCIE